MKKLIIIISLFLTGFVVSSCLSIESIEIKSFKDFEILEFKDNMLTFKTNLVIRNPNSLRMKVLDANFDLKIGDKIVGHLTQMEKLTLEPSSEKEYPVTAKFQITSLKNGLLSLMQIVNRRDSRISVTGTVVGQALIYRKTFQFTDVKIYQ